MLEKALDNVEFGGDVAVQWLIGYASLGAQDYYEYKIAMNLYETSDIKCSYHESCLKNAKEAMDSCANTPPLSEEEILRLTAEFLEYERSTVQQ